MSDPSANLRLPWSGHYTRTLKPRSAWPPCLQQDGSLFPSFALLLEGNFHRIRLASELVGGNHEYTVDTSTAISPASIRSAVRGPRSTTDQSTFHTSCPPYLSRAHAMASPNRLGRAWRRVQALEGRRVVDRPINSCRGALGSTKKKSTTTRTKRAHEQKPNENNQERETPQTK